MEKVYGASTAQDGIFRVGEKMYYLYYGYGEEDGRGFNYRHLFDHEPTESEVRDVIEEHINSDVQERIVTGYRWNGKQVWLSNENQQNYTSDYLAGELPIKVRVYEPDVEPEDDTSGTVAMVAVIETPEELTQFYHGMVSHVRMCVEDGWKEKDAFSYDLLEKNY